MAYLSKDLSVLAYANGFTLWHYTTPDAAAIVDATGYFNAAAPMLRVGDIVIINASGEASQQLVTFVIGGDVTLASMCATASTASTASTAPDLAAENARIRALYLEAESALTDSRREGDRLRDQNAKLVEALSSIVDSANDLLNEMAANPSRQGNWGGLAAHVRMSLIALAAVKEG